MKLICPICNNTTDIWEKFVPESGLICKRCRVPLVPLDRPADWPALRVPLENETISCPRCGYKQVPSARCVNCGFLPIDRGRDLSSPPAITGPLDLFRAARREGIARNLGLGALLGMALLVMMALGSFFFGLINSEPYRLAQSFIKENKEIRLLVGDEVSFGHFPTGSIKTAPGKGEANFTIKVKGPQGSTNVYIALRKRGKTWQVISAACDNRDGTRRTLLTEKKSGKTFGRRTA